MAGENVPTAEPDAQPQKELLWGLWVSPSGGTGVESRPGQVYPDAAVPKRRALRLHLSPGFLRIPLRVLQRGLGFRVYGLGFKV